MRIAAGTSPPVTFLDNFLISKNVRTVLSADRKFLVPDLVFLGKNVIHHIFTALEFFLWRIIFIYHSTFSSSKLSSLLAYLDSHLSYQNLKEFFPHVVVKVENQEITV